MTQRKERSLLRILREREGYTQTQLLDRLNDQLVSSYTKSALSKWENGKTRPPAEVLEELETILGVKDGYILEHHDYLEAAVVRGVTSFRLAHQFQTGNMKLSIVRLVGGDGKIRYTYPEGVQTIFHNTPFSLSEEFMRAFYELKSIRQAEAESRGANFENRQMVRLDDYEITLSDPDERPYPLKLHVSLTDYFTMMVTNRSMYTTLPGSTHTVRDIYAQDPKDFRNSGFANPLAVIMPLVTTKDWKIHVAIRGPKVATNPDNFGPAVSGTANPVLDFDAPGFYNPFLTAQRNAFEKLTQPYKPDFSEITFFGLARTLGFYFPFLFGELRLEMDEDMIRSLTPQNNWHTVRIQSMQFTIEDVTRFIKETYRQMEATGDQYPATTIFTLFQSLIYQYPERWEEIMQAFRDI